MESSWVDFEDQLKMTSTLPQITINAGSSVMEEIKDESSVMETASEMEDVR